MSPDRVEVATSGSIDRHDKCKHCGDPMLYRVSSTTGGGIRSSFCGNSECIAFLAEIPE